MFLAKAELDYCEKIIRNCRLLRFQKVRTKKILYFFNHHARPVADLIAAGQAPSDRLYGVFELRKLGWSVDVCDERLTRLAYFFRKYTLSFVGYSAIKQCLRADVLVVKDNFSLMLTLLALIFRKKIIYLDSLFYIPAHKVRKFFLRLNLILAPTIVSYSQYQVDLWCRELGVNKEKFLIFPYTIDTDFYRLGIEKARGGVESTKKKSYILSVGRDMGRDYKTLVTAAQKADIGLKLVTLPYLVPADIASNPNVEILQNISYPQLFELYSRALLVVVPLINGVEYPSGIRAALEAMLIGKATICTATQILEEYIPKNCNALLYVSPENEEELTAAIVKIMQNAELRKQLEQSGADLVGSRFGMRAFVEALDQWLMLSV